MLIMTRTVIVGEISNIVLGGVFYCMLSLFILVVF